MEINTLPNCDMTDNPTGCCPVFNPEPWDNQELHFRDRLFVRARTISLFYIPLNIGSVFLKTLGTIEDAGAQDSSNFIVMSHDLSPWSAEHLFTAEKDVPGAEMTRLSGDFVTKVFEGPYKNAAKWCKELDEMATAQGYDNGTNYLFYTTCPKCAKTYGKNYVVGIAQVG